MTSDPLVGTWRKVAINTIPLADGYELLHLQADGTAAVEGEWKGERYGCDHRWQRLDATHWRLDALIPAAALPGVDEDVVIPGLVYEVLELSDGAMKLAMRFPAEVREKVHRMLILQGLRQANTPIPPENVHEYQRSA